MNNSTTPCTPQEGATTQVQLVLISVNLILTFVTTLITSTRFRSKCGCAECNMKPSSSAPSPPNVTNPVNVPDPPHPSSAV